MKVKVIETVTEIEATTAEINASQTLAGKLSAILANAFTPYRAYDEEDEEEEEEEGNT